MKQIDSYIPEPELLAEKTAFCGRLCREDCAILDAASPDRVLAYRCRTETVEHRFSTLFGVRAADMRFLRSSLAPHRLLVLSGRSAPVLVSCDLLDSTGLLLALSPHQADTGSFLRALTTTATESKILLSPTLRCSAITAHRDDPEVEGLLSEWAFYASRIVSGRAELGLCTRAMLIANFVGYPIRATDWSAEKLSLPTAVWHRLSALLLCVFLTFRQQNGALRADSLDSAPDSLALRLSLRPADREPHHRNCSPELACAAFLSHPALRDLCVWRTPSGLCLSFKLPRASASLQMSSTTPTQDVDEFVLVLDGIKQDYLNF